MVTEKTLKKLEFTHVIKKSCTAMLAHHFNDLGCHTYWQQNGINLIISFGFLYYIGLQQETETREVINRKVILLYIFNGGLKIHSVTVF
jgi:hypothetical protein